MRIYTRGGSSNLRTSHQVLATMHYTVVLLFEKDRRTLHLAEVGLLNRTVMTTHVLLELELELQYMRTVLHCCLYTVRVLLSHSGRINTKMLYDDRGY